jgi:hypothetical protein
MSSRKQIKIPAMQLAITKELDQLHERLSTIDSLIRSLKEYKSLQPKAVSLSRKLKQTTA